MIVTMSSPELTGVAAAGGIIVIGVFTGVSYVPMITSVGIGVGVNDGVRVIVGVWVAVEVRDGSSVRLGVSVIVGITSVAATRGVFVGSTMRVACAALVNDEYGNVHTSRTITSRITLLG
jgi:hypothetical protein